MAELTITIAGRAHKVACRDGGEAQLMAAAELLDQRARAVAGSALVSEVRTLLLAGLTLADEQLERSGGTLDAALTERLARIAERIEALAGGPSTPAA